MCDAKWLFKVLVIGAILEGCHLISSRGDPNGTAEILWNLSNRAIQSRQYQYPAYQQPQSFMDALASVAYNDELHCVPKLLCELTSSSKPAQSILPFDINLDSLSGVLSTLNAVSPILLFGRAALLGYTSGENANLACSRAFPQCPNDPNQLVNYLNNHNGGFFRYFNGLPQRYRSSESRILSGSGINPTISEIVVVSWGDARTTYA
ncbi:PREDICTED: uncharacterized protein LOC108568755 isoform X2 [Nicrophorus vespilloides]|uniref:Uncharacterized protein LOC108568755 isoform X2 n=1 Tax=Nicrophorus vespilloides TaxID=110193 RepID=A0ABM1NFB8_NICVS|nr:PREDICTED: uncharacterized protein LOC108568755 isoform X2 [Nicrophorus vespilloides]